MLSSPIIKEAQEYLAHDSQPGLDGWLIHDYRRSNPVFWRVVGENVGMVTRPCFLFIPAAGDPRLLVHHVDAGKFQAEGIELVVYRDRQSLLEGAGNLMPSAGRVAMEYSPLGALPAPPRSMLER